MERQQLMDQDELAHHQIIPENEDISVQEILKRVRDFKINPTSFQLPTSERQIKASLFRTMQMSSCKNTERKICYSDIYFPDLSECLDSTLAGSNMMQPFCHRWLLQNGSSATKRIIIDKDERSHTPKSCVNTHDKTEFKTSTPENHVENSLDDYEKAIEKARQTAEKYSVTDDQITESSEKSATFLEKVKLEADDAPIHRSSESCLNTELKAALIENCKLEPISNSLDGYERKIEQARQIAEKYSATENLITEAPKEMPLTFFEKLKIKTDGTPLETSCEKITGLPATSYLEKLKSKREEKILDSTAEICVKSVLNKMKREIYVEVIRKNALNQRTILETNDLKEIGKQNVEIQSDLCESYNETGLKKPKVSLLSSAHGFQWMEETKISKRKSWRTRLAGLFCLRRCGTI